MPPVKKKQPKAAINATNGTLKKALAEHFGFKDFKGEQDQINFAYGR